VPELPSTIAPFSQYALPLGAALTVDVTEVVEVTSVVAAGAVEIDVTVATVDVPVAWVTNILQALESTVAGYFVRTLGVLWEASRFAAAWDMVTVSVAMIVLVTTGVVVE
jgi:hypothetical protein